MEMKVCGWEWKERRDRVPILVYILTHKAAEAQVHRADHMACVNDAEKSRRGISPQRRVDLLSSESSAVAGAARKPSP